MPVRIERRSVLKKVLIANRGEIAVRVIRTCRELGVATVAIYSELDREALHVRLADEAYALGGQTAAESYLNTQAILGVMDEAGPTPCTPATGSSPRTPTSPGPSPSRGVTFIGPPPEAIEVMGDKISSRHAAERAGVSGVPGPVRGPDDARRGVGLRRRVRLAGGHQGGLRRWRPGHEGGGRPRRGQPRPSSRPCGSRRPTSGGTSATSSGTWPGPAMSRCRSSPTPTATPCGWASGTARAQRRHQKLVEESPAPDFPDGVRRPWARPRCGSPRPAGTSTPEPWSSSFRTVSSSSWR